MQKHKNIKALFFLGIFSMLLIHQIVPHLHHQHQDAHQDDVAHHHNNHDEHDHHHHHEDEEDSPQKGFIDWLLETHTHTNTTMNVLVLEHTTFKEIVVQKEIGKTFFLKTIHIVSRDADINLQEWYHPPDNFQNSYIPNLTLRGPPSLG